MPGRTRTLRFVIVAVLALMAPLLTPLAAEASAPPAPAVGSCHTYDWNTFLGVSDSSAPVSCSGPHVARTVFVGRLWTDEAYSSMLNDPKIIQYMVKQCLVPTQQAIGPWKTVAVAGYDGSFFVPTSAEYGAGARWFRCDVSLPGAGHLYPIPNQHPLASPLSPGQSRCIHLTSQGGLPVACAAPHSYRAAGVVWVPGSAYPSRSTWLAVAQAHCPPIVRTSRWYLTGVSSVRWSAGDHYLTCYRPTTT
ncbi:hypothetical protein Back2_19460 [Nocardioides baekrokdamisoli]|uniref:Septum formation-related domain-containing protein n=1 Tax=Nocardioides baekrokdamisoli TaxID=1804624 RepID=A0A3G9J3S3_9ACTN|nr:septum formation family protein [Nocardioides baekrokdamisoli]BBH17659.1 hypothetical protein Back2_19460 [Nocardioides baekrokdamisoli]